MSFVDQLLHDLRQQLAQKSETALAGANAASVSRNQDQRVSARSSSGASEWVRTIALSGVMVAVLIGVQGYLSEQLLQPEKRTSQARVTASTAKQSELVRFPVAWQLDHRLSLDRLQRLPVAQANELTRVSLTPHIDVSEEPAPVDQIDGQEPDRVQASLAAGDGPLLIDPPAAGRVVKTQPNTQALYQRAMDALDQGRDATSLAILTQLLKLDPHHLVARRMAISLAIEQHQAEQGQAWLSEGLALHPEDASLRTLQAKQLSQAGDVASAVDVLQSIEHPDADSLGLKAGLLVKQGKHTLAATAYEQALKSNPDNATWWLGLGLSWQAQGQGGAAREAFARAYRLGQLGPDVQTWLEQQL